MQIAGKVVSLPAIFWMLMDTGKLTGHLAALGAYTIFGLNIVFCKDIANSEAVSPVVLFTFRALGASALFWLLSLLMPREKVEKGDLPKIALAGFFGLFLTQMAFLLAIPMATAIDTAILSTLGPVFTMFFAYIFLKEPITGKKAGGVALSLAGVIFLILNSVHAGGASTSKPLGIVLLLVNSLTFALYLGKFRPLIAKYSVVTFMKWAFLFCLLLALPFAAKGLIETAELLFLLQKVPLHQTLSNKIMEVVAEYILALIHLLETLS